MKEYYKEHSKRNYEKYGKDYYIKNKDMINEKYKQYRKDYYLKNQNDIRQKYVNRHYNILFMIMIIKILQFILIKLY